MQKGSVRLKKDVNGLQVDLSGVLSDFWESPPPSLTATRYHVELVRHATRHLILSLSSSLSPSIIFIHTYITEQSCGSL